MKVALAIPCYNCEPQISRVLTELDGVLSAAPALTHVFLIDNRSTDGVVEVARTIKTRLKNSEKIVIYRNVENVGLGGTHKVAYDLARSVGAGHLAILHGDHQARPDDLLRLLTALEKFSGGTILGSRFADLSLLSGYSYIRIFGNLVLNVLYSVTTGVKVSDLGSGLNIFKLSDFESDDLHKFDNGFTFNMDLLLYLISKRRRLHYVPIHWSTSDQISNARALSVGIKTLKKLWNWRFSKTEEFSGHFKTEKII